MRTTVDLPDALVRAARVRAAESDESLKALFVRALTKELDRPAGRTRRTLPVIESVRPARSEITATELTGILSSDDVVHDLP